jgi:4-amino-4-deoxy-L-arabinose transferase-like glycosyltransferase
METVSTRTKAALLLLAAAVYAAGLFIPVMDIDAATYAFMSRQIAGSPHFWKSLLEPAGFLDKPPLLFFLSALSFKLFGVSTAAYKLPSLLVTVLGFYATFRLGALLYDRRTGILAACMLGSCEGFIFFANDVRTDALLAGTVIVGIWQLVAFLETRKIRFFIGGFCGLGLAMLAKGPLGFMVPALAIGSWLAAKRDGRILFKWYWPAGLLIIGLLLSPMLVGLYRQYGWYGIRFFFWTQSFGRITGESHWNNGSDYFFFVHTFLWAFLPWAFTAYYAVGVRLLASARRRFDAATAPDLLLLGGTVFPFIALSLSHYKLPHYIFVVFPLAAIITARTVVDLLDRPGGRAVRGLFITQLCCCVLGGAFVLSVLTLVFPCRNIVVWLAVAAFILLTGFFALPRHNLFTRVIVTSLFAILGVNLVMNCWFFPHLLGYQGGSTAAAIMLRHHAPLATLRACRAGAASANFYTGTPIPLLDDAALADQAAREELWVYTDAQGVASMRAAGAHIQSLDSFPNAGITTVTAKFLYFKTRPQVAKIMYVVNSLP